MLYRCRRARIQGARFSGGPKVYGDTAHFAIRAYGGGQHRFDGNRFYPAADGGMAVQCIMLVASHDNVLSGNDVQHPYEKLVYGYGDRNLVQNNTVVGNRGFIPGTNVQGTMGAVIRFHGSHNRIEGNQTRDCGGGVQMMEGTAHTIVNNQFLSCGQSAIAVYQGDLSGSTIRGNVGTYGALAGFLAGDGIHLISDKPARRVVVEDNQMSGFSVADPIATIAGWRGRTRHGRNSLVKPSRGNGRYYVARTTGVSGSREPSWPTTPGATVADGSVTWETLAYEGGQAEIKLSGSSAAATIRDSSIANNTVRGGRLGIVSRFVTDSRIAGNLVDAQEGLVEEAGARNVWQSNRGSGAANGVRNLAASSRLQ
jgi:hypothetical protein